MAPTESQIQKLKSRYLTYYEDVPVQKYAAMYIGRDEDTIIKWRKDDAEFADAVQMAKANWIRKKVIATRAEFALERLASEVFSPRLTVESESDDKVKSSHEFLREIAETLRNANKDAKPASPVNFVV